MICGSEKVDPSETAVMAAILAATESYHSRDYEDAGHMSPHRGGLHHADGSISPLRGGVHHADGVISPHRGAHHVDGTPPHGSKHTGLSFFASDSDRVEGSESPEWRSEDTAEIIRPSRMLSKRKCAGDDILEEIMMSTAPFDSSKRRLGRDLFAGVITATIIINAIQLGLCVAIPDQRLLCTVIEIVCTVIFTAEMLMKVHADREEYFRSIINLIDFFLVIIGLVDVVLQFTSTDASGRCPSCNDVALLRLMKLLRALRLFRVLRARRELVVLVTGLMASLKAMVWVATLLGVLIYASAIFMVGAVGNAEDIEWATDTDYFDSLWGAAFTLFNIAILAEWPEVVRPTVTAHPSMIIFFVAYVFLSTFGILNLLIGIIAESTATAASEFEAKVEADKKKEKLQQIIDVADIVFEADKDCSGGLSDAELGTVKKELIEQLLDEVSLPYGFGPRDLHLMVTPEPEMTKKQFVLTMRRLIFANSFERDCLFMHSINDLKRRFIEVQNDLRRNLKAILRMSTSEDFHLESQRSRDRMSDEVRLLREGLQNMSEVLRNQMANDVAVARVAETKDVTSPDVHESKAPHKDDHTTTSLSQSSNWFASPSQELEVLSKGQDQILGQLQELTRSLSKAFEGKQSVGDAGDSDAHVPQSNDGSPPYSFFKALRQKETKQDAAKRGVNPANPKQQHEFESALQEAVNNKRASLEQRVDRMEKHIPSTVSAIVRREIQRELRKDDPRLTAPVGSLPPDAPSAAEEAIVQDSGGAQWV